MLKYFAAAIAALALAAGSVQAAQNTMVVEFPGYQHNVMIKSFVGQNGSCDLWIEHITKEGFEVRTIPRSDFTIASGATYQLSQLPVGKYPATSKRFLCFRGVLSEIGLLKQ